VASCPVTRLNRSGDLSVDCLFDLIECLHPANTVPEDLYADALALLDEGGTGSFSWAEFLSWARMSLPLVAD